MLPQALGQTRQVQHSPSSAVECPVGPLYNAILLWRVRDRELVHNATLTQRVDKVRRQELPTSIGTKSLDGGLKLPLNERKEVTNPLGGVLLLP